MSQFAWVTLATNDSYSLGALVVANSLKKVNTSHQIAVLITPGVSESMKTKLEATFDAVVEVNVLDSKDEANLALLSRPELGITFTKLHCWRLTQYEKCVFLDADTFVLQNSDELFEREELSAAPDVGWPDCFNSGVFVFKPSLETFGRLIEFAKQQGSFDGGDQGLLNSFFSDWAQKDISKHLPFIYNTCSTACYSYLPAFKEFGQNVKILHFIGQVKPWLLNFDSQTKTAVAPQGFGHLGDFLQQWWNIFCADVHPSLTTEMTTSVHQQYGDEIPWYQNSESPSLPVHPNPPEIEFIDPWDTYYSNSTTQTDSDLHDHYVTTSHENVEYRESRNDHEHYHESFQTPNYHTIDREDHQHNHKPTHIDSQCTITEPPHISIRSSSNDDINSNSNFDQNRNQNVDASVHSINTNSFLTFTHNNPHTNTSESTSIGNETRDNGERDRDSLQRDDHNHGVDDVEKDESSDTCEEGGLAGALAQLTLGTPASPEQQAYEESVRRQCWEAGNIDYLGKDSFDNIWKRITKTIETKSDTSVPPPEKNRSPTPQPEEKLAVEEKKEVKVGPSFNESEEDVLRSTQIQEQTVTEVTTDGRTIEKKIVTYPGEETTEIEEIEEVDGQTMSVKRTTVSGENKEVAPKPKTLSEVKNEPVVLVPGYRTVEFDEKTNSTIVTEKTTTGSQQTITTVQEDGTKKIQTKTFFDPVEIPGEEEEEETYEETETFEPGSKTTTATTSKDVVDNVTSNKSSELEITEVETQIEEQVASNTNKQDESTTVVKTDTGATETDEKNESKILTDLKNQPVVIVPGHQKVEFDEKTNTTTVTEKTTTGYQQTLTTITEDNRTIVQTKVFYDPVPVEGSIESTVNQSIVNQSAVDKSVVEKETEESKILTDLKSQPVVIVPGHQKVEFDEKTNTTTVTEKTTTGHQQTITTITEDNRTIVQTKVFYDPVPTGETEEIEEVETYEETQTVHPTTRKTTTTTTTGTTGVEENITSAENVTEVQKTEVQTVKQQEESQVLKETVSEVQSDSTTETTDVKDTQLVLAGPTSLTQKKTTPEGKEIEVTTTVSDDGKTKTLRKTVRQPSEEIEIEEYEETQSYEPGEVKVVTTSKTIPLVEALEDAAKDIVDNSKTVVDTSKPVVDNSKTVVDTAKKSKTIAKTQQQENTSQIEVSEQTATGSKTTTTAIQEQTEVKSQVNVSAKVATSATKTEAKQTTTAAKQTSTEAKQTTTSAKQTSTEAKQTTTAAKQTLTEAKQTTTSAKQTTTEAKQITTEAKLSKTDAKQIKDANVSTKAITSKTNEKDTKTTTVAGKSTAVTKKDDSQTKTVTGAVKKDSVVKSDSKISKTPTPTSTDVVATIDKPKVTKKNGETTTEVVRRVPGGTEHTHTTVRADGTTKMEKKTVYDVVEDSDEEEEYEEEYEEEIEEEKPPVKTTTTKTTTTTKAPKPVGAITTKGPKSPTVTEATPPNTPPAKPLKSLVIGGASSELKVEQEILDTPPLDSKAEQLRKKKLQSAPASKVTPKVEKSAVEAPKPPPRKKEVKKPATEK